MTVTYTSEVTTCSGLGCFLKLLVRWKGSIYKIMWADLLVFLTLYYGLKMMYMFLLTEDQKIFFRETVKYCEQYGNLIPITFVLGFYVNVVMTRWWSQYTSIPFPDNLAILIGASIKGQDDRAKMVRRTIVRYVCLTFTITLTMMSPKVKKRFPTLDHFIEAGLLTDDERKIMEELDLEFPSYSKYWLPLAWASNIVTRSRHEGLIRDDVSVKTILEELNTFRSRCGGMLDYDWISIPLVYTQVVTLAVYFYFLTTLFKSQYIESNDIMHYNIQAYFPIIAVLEFFFYMGWLKVAETLINPYGDDDDDFEVVWMVDRHLQVSYLLVDKIHQEHPRLMKDQYWYEKAPNQLPHTMASFNSMSEYPVSSTRNIRVKLEDQDFLMPHDTEEPDSGRPRSGSLLWRIYGLRQRKRNSSIPFKRIKVIKEEKTKEQHDPDVNEYMLDEVPEDKSASITESTSADFEALKRSRQKQQKQRMLKYMRLLKENKLEMQEQLLDDIVNY